MISDFSSSASSDARPIFMVDDEEVDRILFARLLRESGIAHPLRTFEHGEDLLDALIAVLRGSTPPLACFVDVRMSGMNGFDVLRWIRCQHALDSLPVIMLSSSEETGDLNEAQHFGAQCYIAKFPRPEQFRGILEEAERVAAAAPGSAFRLSCNLLLRTPHAIR